MNIELKQLYRDMEGRYPSVSEAARLEQYAADQLERVASAEAIARAEAAILDEVVAHVMSRFPQIPGLHGPGASARVKRDQAMVLRYAVSSMLLTDPNFIYDKLAVWLRTILFALCSPDHVLAGLRGLDDACRKHLAQMDAARLQPFLSVVLEEFTKNARKEAA